MRVQDAVRDLIVVHEREHEVVVLVGVGALQVGLELAHVRGRSHERRNSLDMGSQLGVTYIFCEPLVMIVFAMTSCRVNRIEASNLVKNSRSDPGIHEVIGVFGDLVGPLGGIVAGPSPEPANLLVERVGEGPGVRLQFLGNELLENLDEGVLASDLVVAGRLVNERDDADRGSPL